MGKTKSVYICNNCGASYAKWMGKCTACNQWNTVQEEIVALKEKVGLPHNTKGSPPKRFSEIPAGSEARIPTPSGEFNRVLGGGIVPGSIILIGGEPGIGKSTLVLQIALRMRSKKILYVSGEESLKQLKLRADRIGPENNNCYVLSETLLERVFYQADQLNPDILIIDSIQTLQTELMESSPGSVAQVRECTAGLLKYAKTRQVAVLLIGHITKEGHIAGPKILEHIVDCVLQFEGDRNHIYRILRAHKNRFGSTAELGIFEMQGSGLREVDNPSELLLSHLDEQLSGTAISASIEGLRPFMIEVQALVGSAVYGTPQRSATGFDLRRLHMLLAVLEKRAGFRLATKDVFLNIAGGIKVDDPGIDLAVIMSILSSEQDASLEKTICFAGEVGLSGEIRPVNRVEQRIIEAEKLGFSQIFVSKYNKKGLNLEKQTIQVIFVSKVEEVLKKLF